MKQCKRIEIVIERPLERRLSQLLDALGVAGYTVIPRASGQGDHGRRRADDPTGTDTNCVFIIIIDDDDLLARIIAELPPLLSRFGGICTVSDALLID